MVDGATTFVIFFSASVLGGIVSGIVEHWLATEPTSIRARWRVGPRRILEEIARDEATRVRERRRGVVIRPGRSTPDHESP
jgi:hypothetical protein